MCGRFTLGVDGEVLQEVLELGTVPAGLEPRYNIAPTQDVAVVTDPESRDVKLFRWGLVPSWAKDLSIGNRLINARAETVAEKPSFRAAFRKRRCLVLADGFYEWRKLPGEKRSQPYFFRLEDGEPFAFAGLWEIWSPPGEEGDRTYSCTLITAPANELVAPIHSRNPVILPRDQMWRWIDDKTPASDLHSLLVPYAAEEMMAYPVSKEVNSPFSEGAKLIEPELAAG